MDVTERRFGSLFRGEQLASLGRRRRARNTHRVAFPIHVLTLNAMGLHLLDYLQFEDLGAACEQRARWEFLFVAAPLRVSGGTGSPINPIAVF